MTKFSDLSREKSLDVFGVVFCIIADIVVQLESRHWMDL
jgi:hypothetical protein